MGYDTPVNYQIALLLENNLIGTFGTDIFCSKEPDSPDSCLTIYNTGGIPSKCLDPDERSDEILNIQIRVRNNTYRYCHYKMDAIINVLHKQLPTLNDMTMEIYMVGLPMRLPRDTTNRCFLIENFSLLRHLTVGD